MKMSKNERCIATAYTGLLFCKWEEFHEYAETLLSRPIFTHEFGDKGIWKIMKSLVKQQFIHMVSEEQS